MRMPLSCCSGSRLLIPRARNLARTGRNFCSNLGQFKRPSTADGAANA
jgi:hypothetical protein